MIAKSSRYISRPCLTAHKHRKPASLGSPWIMAIVCSKTEETSSYGEPVQLYFRPLARWKA